MELEGSLIPLIPDLSWSISCFQRLTITRIGEYLHTARTSLHTCSIFSHDDLHLSITSSGELDAANRSTSDRYKSLQSTRHLRSIITRVNASSLICWTDRNMFSCSPIKSRKQTVSRRAARASLQA